MRGGLEVETKLVRKDIRDFGAIMYSPPYKNHQKEEKQFRHLYCENPVLAGVIFVNFEPLGGGGTWYLCWIWLKL